MKMISLIFSLFSALLVSACENAASPLVQSNDASAQPGAPAFDQTIDDRKLAILCDPSRFRLSIRAQANAESLDTGYPKRTVIDPEHLVERFPAPGGVDQYQGNLIRYERCGPLIIGLQGEFLNANLEGELGAIPPFAAVWLFADNTRLFPEAGRASVRLAECDDGVRRWGDCPNDYAVRIDFDYVPAQDPFDYNGDRLHVREWIRSGNMIGTGEMRTSERRSSVNPHLGRWWANRR